MEQSKWRKLNGILDLPDEIAYGLLCAIVEPRRQRINWPKKSHKRQLFLCRFVTMIFIIDKLWKMI